MAKVVPPLAIPASGQTVKVSIIDFDAFIDAPAAAFLHPPSETLERLHCLAHSFLIEHSSGEKVLFDLGVRKDWKNLPPPKVQGIERNGMRISTEKDVADVLQEAGIDVRGDEIGAVIWSHCHLDHVGNMLTFPSKTTLAVGDNFKNNFLPGYPQNPEAGFWQHDFDGRSVQEIDFTRDNLKLGRFRAFDCFGDGSFYLLDTPGHIESHMSGLARTSASHPTFVLFAGDASHHPSQFRPSEYLPLPVTALKVELPHVQTCVDCLTSPLFGPSSVIYHDVENSKWSIQGLQEFDADESVLVVLAQDNSLTGAVEFFPDNINDWHEQGVKENSGGSFWRISLPSLLVWKFRRTMNLVLDAYTRKDATISHRRQRNNKAELEHSFLVPWELRNRPTDSMFSLLQCHFLQRAESLIEGRQVLSAF